jgi:tetratricopeptide (TPR) repeat protein
VLPAQADNTAEAALSRALELEGSNKCREAIPLYRQAAQVPDPTGAVLGLERCYHMIGRPDSLLPLLDTLFLRKPKDPTLRVVQLRTLSTVRDERGLRLAFEQWSGLEPREPAPYREYARILLDMGRALAADSVLRSAVAALGSSRELAAEFAQMQAALGLWVPAARSWRQASQQLPYLEQAAIFSLFAAPAAMRDSVRDVMREPPVAVSARRVLAGLEVRWHAPREGWAALRELPPSDTVLRVWTDFAAEAEQSEAWLTARDVWARAFSARPADRNLAVRAATAALAGGDPASAVDLLTPLRGIADSVLAPTVTLLRVRALGVLGRAAEAESLITAHAAVLDDNARLQAHRALAWAWIRSGDLARARQSLAIAGGDTEEGERVSAWIALYEGDLKTARAGLRRTDESSNDVVTAMALLSRTRLERSTAVGEAFLALARGDTAQAARLFDRAAQDVPDAAPYLLGTAARLHLAAADTSRSVTLWQLILSAHAEAPEAAESDLEWARVLRRRGDTAGAIARLEHLILTYSESALVPQARRELELSRGSVPPVGLALGRMIAAGPRPAVRVSRSVAAASQLPFARIPLTHVCS